MRKFIIALAASAVLFMSPMVTAEFTDAEKVEAVKLVQANVAIGAGIDSAGHDIDPFGTVNRVPLVAVIRTLTLTSAICAQAWQALSSTTKHGNEAERAAAVRADEITLAKKRIPQCVSGMQDAASIADGIAGSNIDSQQLRDAADELATFNWSLSYADPLPEDWPRIIGPHGILDPAQGALRRSHQYFINATLSAVNWYSGIEVYDDSANNAMSQVFRFYGEGLRLMMRTWGLGSAVVLPIDQAVIDQDFAASTAFRPKSFFRLLRAVELMHGQSNGPQAFSGRPMDAGFTQQLLPIVTAMTNVHRALAPLNTLSEVARWSTGNRGGRDANRDGTGRFMAHMGDLADFWKDADRWSNFAIGFFFDIIPPAPTGTITCGANTTLQGQECVAPAPVVCPGIPESKRLRVDSLVSDDVSGTLQFSCRL